MNELELKLRNEESSYLQDKLRTNSYSDEAAAIVREILIERGEKIPIAETEEEAEANYNNDNKVSLILIGITIGYLLALYIGNVTTGRFIIFTILYISVFRYTLSLRKK